jgi:hypothetical protein
MKNLFLTLLFLVSSGCAFRSSPTEMNQRENKVIEEKNRVLRNNYDLVTGFYKGKLHLPNEDREVTLGLYTLDVREGSNSSGEPVFKPMLKAVYRQMYPVEMPIIFDVRYVPETGELSFIKSSGSTDSDIITTIFAKFQGFHIIGEAKTPTGRLGTLDLEFIQKEVEAPVEGDEDRIADEMRKQYESLSGTYIGKIKSSTSNLPNEGGAVGPQSEWDVEVGIYTLEVKSGTKPNGETILKPVLKAVFKQNSPVAPNIILEVQYTPETQQLIFINPAAGASDLQTMTLKLDKKVMTGVAKKSSGIWGNVNLSFSSKTVETPSAGDQEDYNRRITEEYKKIVGTYRGLITPTTPGVEDFEVEVKLFIVQEAGTTGRLIPRLKAYYHRVSDEYNATDLTMAVDYKTELNPPGLDMSGQRSNGGLTYFVVLNAVIANKQITGEYHDQRGQEGPFVLQLVNP